MMATKLTNFTIASQTLPTAITKPTFSLHFHYVHNYPQPVNANTATVKGIENLGLQVPSSDSMQ